MPSMARRTVLVLIGLELGSLSAQAFAALAYSKPAAFQGLSSGRQDVFYRDKNDRLIQVWCSEGKWHPEVRVEGGVLSAPAAFQGYQKGRVDVFYQGEGNKLFQLWWNPDRIRWEGPQAIANDCASAPAAYGGFDSDKRQDVFYTGTDHKIHQVWWNPGAIKWERGVIEGSDGAQGSPCAFYGLTKGRQDLFYVKSDHRVWQSFWDKDKHKGLGGWESKAIPGAENAQTDVAAYGGFSDATREDVFWTGTDGAIWQAWWGLTWHVQKLPYADKVASIPAVDHDLSPGRQDIFYATQDGDLFQLYYANGGWHRNELRSPQKAASDLVVYRGMGAARHDLFFLDPTGALVQGFYNGRWNFGIKNRP